jgi:hypothetical protein
MQFAIGAERPLPLRIRGPVEACFVIPASVTVAAHSRRAEADRLQRCTAPVCLLLGEQRVCQKGVR